MTVSIIVDVMLIYLIAKFLFRLPTITDPPPAPSILLTPSLTPSESVLIEFPDDGFDYNGCDVSSPGYVADGYCDSYYYEPYNSPECNYDGGDCCPDTCIDAEYDCGVNGYDCIDPEIDSESEFLMTVSIIVDVMLIYI